MKVSGMHRMQKVIAAVKMSEMAQLGARRRSALAARAEAEALRAQSRRGAVPDNAASMRQQSTWQQALEARARRAEDRAAAIEAELVPLGARLSRTLGRENATKSLISAATEQARRLTDRRAEDPPARKA